MRYTDLCRVNQTARAATHEFRASNGGIGSVHAQVFHSSRRDYPYYGYVEVEIDHCRPFLMFSNNDDAVAQVFFWYGANSYEQRSMIEWVKYASQSTAVLDIGAFTGVYSLAATMCSDKTSVYAFEPVRRVWGRLIANVQVNRLGGRITPVNKAAWDAADEQQILQFRGDFVLGSGASIIQKPQHPVQGKEIVETISIDEYTASTKIDLIKIDVEQAEIRVLHGARGLLARDRPVVLVECIKPLVPDLVCLFEDHRYTVRHIDESTQRLVNLDECNPGYTSNYLATP